MPDRFDAATRSRIMRAIRSRGTKPEMRLYRALHDVTPSHVACSRAKNRLPGRPDVVVLNGVTGTRVAVFVHGCFWHCCRKHFRLPKSRVDEWREHFAKNVRRDRRVRRQLRALGWRTMVVWEHEDAGIAAARVVRRAVELNECGRRRGRGGATWEASTRSRSSATSAVTPS